MGRKVKVKLYGQFVGTLIESSDGYLFTYSDNYAGQPISLSMPTRQKEHFCEKLHPFFRGLAPEGWLRKRYSELQRIDENDDLGFLVENGGDLLGAISIEGASE